MDVHIEVRRSSADDWASANPILEDGEMGYDKTNALLKIGDGVTPWTGLQGFAGTPPIIDPTTNRFVTAINSKLAQDIVDPAQPTGSALARVYVAQTPDGQDQILTERALPLLPWVAAASNRDSAPATVLCIGDGITEGAGIAQVMNTWPHRLGAALRGVLPRGSGGVNTSPGYFPAFNNRPSGGFAYPVTITGTGTAPVKTAAGIGPAAGNSYILAAGGQSLTYATPSPATSVDIHWASGSGAVLSVSIDGGAAAPYNFPATGLTQVLSIPLARGIHTIVVQAASSSTASTILGFIQHDGDEASGLRVHGIGYTGSTSSDWATATGTATSAAYKDLSPDLVIVELGVRDFIQSGSSAALQANLGTLLTNIKTWAAKQVSFVLLLPPTPYTAAPAEPWSNYAAAIKSAALARTDTVVLDLSRRIYAANTGDPSGLYFDTQILPNDKGAAVYGQATTALLTEGLLAGPTSAVQTVPGQYNIVPISAVNGTVLSSGKVTFSGVSTVSINGCFSSMYENYLVILDVQISSSAAFGGWLRANGVDEKGANYATAYLAGQAATQVTANGSVGGTNLSFVIGSGNDVAVPVTFFSPGLPRATRTSSLSSSTATGGIPSVGIATSRHSLAVAYDGFTLFATAGTLSGSIRVYGYNNG